VSYPRNNYHRRTRRYEKPRFLTRAEEERRNAIDDENHRREEAARWHAINTALKAQWDALTPEKQAEATAHHARIRAEMHAEAEADREWRERKSRERNDPMSTFGT